MHILFLTDNFPPEVNAPANRTFEHCREWVRAGHQVSVITCAPNFPKGAVFGGYKNRIWQTEIVDGIQIMRVWSYISANKGVVRRTLDYVSYMISAIVAAPFIKRPDLVVATSPQFFTAVAGYFVGFYRRIPFVFELRDLWPVSIQAVGAIKNGSYAIYLLGKLEMFLYHKAARIISVTHSFSTILIDRGVDGGKIDVITNGVDLSRFQPRLRDAELVERYGLEGKFVAGYIGTHGMAHALETVLETADKIRNKAGGNDFRFILLGHGARKQAMVDRARELQLDNVIFVDTVPRTEVNRYWSLLNVSIIHLKKEPTFTTVIPSKLFECMAMGIPVLHGVEGESAKIVEKNKIGLTFEPENAQELMKKLERLKNDEDLYRKLRTNCLVTAPVYERSGLAVHMLQSLEGVLVKETERKMKQSKTMY
jgi:glycosyltransferase involved in cell wall biosynthesis